ncbi:MAG TPA: hypothetical protein VJX23_16100 [Candidatus Binataceae bacterium]|nr:hypothetical protein [Candidatus Binataceae bacterium]
MTTVLGFAVGVAFPIYKMVARNPIGRDRIGTAANVLQLPRELGSATRLAVQGLMFALALRAASGAYEASATGLTRSARRLGLDA